MDYQDPENKALVLMLWGALAIALVWLIVTGRAVEAARRIIDSFRFLG